MNVKFDFNTPPADNVAFMMAKKPELHFDYDEIKFESHQRAFTVAKVTQIELLAEIQESLETAFVEGQSYQTWLKNLKPTLEKRGWLGLTSVTNPKTGETKDIFVGARRLKTIFYTNARTAYAQSEARAGYELPLSQFIRYVAIMDNRVRPEHAALHGKIAHRDDKFWATNYPPNGWNCRCAVEFVSKDEMDAHGWAEMSDIEKRLNFAEDDWAYDTRNLKGGSNYLQQIIEDKLTRLVKNKSATAALNALKGEIAAQNQRFKDVNALWSAEIARDASGKKIASKYANLGKIDNFSELEGVLGTQNAEILISDKMIDDHKRKHPEITPFDYVIVPYMLEKSAFKGLFKDKNETPRAQNLYVVANKLNRTYRLALGVNGNSVRVGSLLANKNILQEMRDDINKVEISLR